MMEKYPSFVPTMFWLWYALLSNQSKEAEIKFIEFVHAVLNLGKYQQDFEKQNVAILQC